MLVQAFTGNAIGALTFSFIEAMETESKLTYGKLLNSMHKKVNQAQQVVGRIAPFASSKSQVFCFRSIIKVLLIRHFSYMVHPLNQILFNHHEIYISNC